MMWQRWRRWIRKPRKASSEKNGAAPGIGIPKDFEVEQVERAGRAEKEDAGIGNTTTGEGGAEAEEGRGRDPPAGTTTRTRETGETLIWR